MRLLSVILAGTIFAQSIAWAIPRPPYQPQLTSVRVGRHVKITMDGGEIIVGRVVAFDGCRVVLDSQPSEIECDRIRSVESVKRKPAKPPRMGQLSLPPLKR